LKEEQCLFQLQKKEKKDQAAEVVVVILTTAVAEVVTDGNSKLIYLKKELNLSSFFLLFI
jgi:hypothetical protein